MTINALVAGHSAPPWAVFPRANANAGTIHFIANSQLPRWLFFMWDNRSPAQWVPYRPE